MVTLKPRYSEQMESGVLYFVAPAKVQSEKLGSGVEISHKVNNIPEITCPYFTGRRIMG